MLAGLAKSVKETMSFYPHIGEGIQQRQFTFGCAPEDDVRVFRSTHETVICHRLAANDDKRDAMAAEHVEQAKRVSTFPRSPLRGANPGFCGENAGSRAATRVAQGRKPAAVWQNRQVGRRLSDSHAPAACIVNGC